MMPQTDWEHGRFFQPISPLVPVWLEQSWMRCRSRLNPTAPRRTTHLSSDVLKLLLRQHSGLLDLARPIMEDILQVLEPLQSILLLCDNTGCVLDLLMTNGTEAILEQMELTPGLFLDEAHAGTNGIGMALIEANGFQVIGQQHFLVHWHHLATTAAPLFTLEGQMIGVLGLIQPAHESNQLALGLVVSAAKAIEYQYLIEHFNHKLNHYQNELNTIINATSEPVIAWRADGTVTCVNRQAAEIIGQPRERIVGRSLDHVLTLPAALQERVQAQREASDIEVVLSVQQTEYNCLANLHLMRDEAQQIIFVLTLRPIQQLQQLVNRFIGAQVRFGIANLVGSSEPMRRLRRQAQTAARGSAPILITGETGTGKSVLAQVVHALSSRSSGPFISINCRAMPREMALEELMGFEASRSSETGQPSKLELAHGGTLFLSEIEALPLNAQAALLRTLETNNVIRFGGVRQIPVNVRVIVSTTVSLDERVASGDFRADLFFQLSGIHMVTPPLRERLSDIPELTADILAKLNHELGREMQLRADALKLLCDYDYPGNLHELQAIIERAASKTEDEIITPDIITESMRDHRRLSGPAGAPISQSLHQMERVAIVNALTQSKGNMTRAARILGIGRTTLWRKMRRYHLLH